MDNMHAPRVSCERRPDGVLIIKSKQPLGDYADTLNVYLRHWAKVAPQRAFICQRGASSGSSLGEWRELTYGEAYQRARSVAQGLIDAGLNGERPVMMLAGNSIEHAVMMLGCYLAGVPFAPISPTYALPSSSRKLRTICRLISPAMLVGEDVDHLNDAVAATGSALPSDCRRLTLLPSRSELSVPKMMSFHEIASTSARGSLDSRSATVNAQTVAKFLFTSGSTGTPKAVPNTHRMMCANVAMMALTLPPNPRKPPIFVDWLPWSHTFGGNVIFNWILRDGGTLYLDEGRPTPELFSTTLENLLDVAPTHYFNVPAGYAILVDRLEENVPFSKHFFGNLELCFYGGSGLPQSTWDRLQRTSIDAIGRSTLMTTGCGSTETAPFATFLNWRVDRAGIIGLPLPGVEVKLVPTESRFEMRLKGANVFGGYHGQPELTRGVFDDEGFYRTGDAVRLENSDDPSRGLVFEGRTVEDFKLATGTFVNVGLVRLALLSQVPFIKDAVIVGPERPWLGLLAWLDVDRCRVLVGDRSASLLDLTAHPGIRSIVEQSIAAYNQRAGGSSRRILRFTLLTTQPSVEEGEITEKGYINQKRSLSVREAEVNQLYEENKAPLP